MRHIKPRSAWVRLVVMLPLFWIGVTCQVPGYSITVNSSVSVQEGLCVSIPCTFTADYSNTFTGSTGYWYQYNGNNIVASNDKSYPGVKNNFHLTGNPDTGDCSLTISDARGGDRGIYYFRYEDRKDSTKRYSYTNSGETTPRITVTDLTDEPVVSDLGTVIAGVEKTVTCSPPRNCPATSLTFQWRKSNVPGIWRENSANITFTPSLDDDNTTITCEMSHSKGKTTQRTIHLHVYNKVSYRYIAIGIISGLSVITIIILLYKVIKMKKHTKSSNYSKAEEPSASADPTTDVICSESDHKAKEVTDKERNPDTKCAKPDQEEDVQYTAVVFRPKPSNLPSEEPGVEYAQIQVK
ncbi:myeloid cell surface antigen CD33-like isoform X2 [Engystomops pustulosus]|uniref:myeloid cell surface antigen CD33-like isoform X2 n=1 Tax=Engystomops pustulosus TaxID=76066 RepID=UPI003AFA444C